jgi:peptidoglycan/xylan/chitin deacetylase (PgdA/CDA1 family)
MIIVNYHQISAGRASHRYAMRRELFQAQIDALVDHGFSFVTLAELCPSPSQDHLRQCAITFDDGRLGAYQHGSPILRKRGIKATYFVCPDWLEKKPAASAESYSDFMTWGHVAELAGEGNVIGSHGKSHLPFFEIDAEATAREVSESRRLIEQRLGVSCQHFAAPWGQINRAVMTLVRDCGYETLSSTIPGPNKVPYNLFRLRRLDSSCYPSVPRFNKAILSHVDAHSRFDVALLELPENWATNISQIEAIARFDLAVCLDDRAYELCIDLGLPCLRQRPESVRNSQPLRDLLLNTHGEMARDREMTFTPLTLRESHSAWTYLLSFLPGTNRTRSSTRSRISTRP